jgi:hypothetical protein
MQCFTFCWPCIMLWFLVNDQLDAQFFTMYLFLTLCMFRAHRAHHQERQIVSTQPLVTVTLCRWSCRVQVEVHRSSLPTWTWHGHRHRVSYQRLCWHNFSLLRMSTMCLKHVELKIKINIVKNCVSRWSFTKNLCRVVWDIISYNSIACSFSCKPNIWSKGSL